MGLPERRTDAPKNQEATRRWRPTRRPRTRRCLLKGCPNSFHPQQASERYCSAPCREKAREWSAWKTQQIYRATPKGKKMRNAQSQRYRERVRNRKEQACETARVSSPNFFRRLLRPTRLLPGIRTHPEIPAAKVLLEAVPARDGARFGAGTTMARAADRITAVATAATPGEV